MKTFRELFTQLLDSLSNTDGFKREAAVQDFFERNPQLLVGSEFVEPKIVLSKWKIGSRVTDFAYVNPTSGPDYLRLIEIEDPTKRIFTGRDDFTADFNHALQQVHDWLIWCSENRDELRELSRIMASQYGTNEYFFLPRGFLFYGRRTEINTPLRQDRWKQKVASEEVFVEVRTFDGLMDRSDFAFEHNEQNAWRFECVNYANRRLNKKH